MNSIKPKYYSVKAVFVKINTKYVAGRYPGITSSQVSEPFSAWI
jgi:hypothetical protein